MDQKIQNTDFAAGSNGAKRDCMALFKMTAMMVTGNSSGLKR
jgi:hypothetical protein